MSCEYITKPTKCKGHKNTIKAILNEFHVRADFLIKKVRLKSLVRYVHCSSTVDKFYLKIYLVQEFVEGIRNIRSICENDRLFNISAIGKDVLESIVYLQNMSIGITHGYLSGKSIFLDHSGVCRVSHYNLIPYLKYLQGVYEIHKESDMNALGKLINDLSNVLLESTRDFVIKCRSGRITNTSDLLKHPFISNIHYNEKPRKIGLSLINFDIEKELGRGSFGVVLKAKQHVDKKVYAIKIISMPRNKNAYEKFSREAELMAGINHKNIARYITSWKQMNNPSEFQNQSSARHDNEPMDVSQSSSE